MGLSLFSRPSNPESQYLASFYGEFLKTFKMTNKILSEDNIVLIQAHLENGNMSRAASIINDALKDIENAPLSIAVTGETGTGKSTFINVLRGVGHEEPGAAEIGPVETTMERKAYDHPKFPNVFIWDLPGIGSPKFQAQKYLQEMKFGEYDLFIIMSSTRFTENDANLAKAIEKMRKKFYFVRAKVDSDLQNEKMSKPHIFDKEKTLQKIRDNCLHNLLQAKVKEPKVFLISNTDLSDYDFPKLENTLLSELPAHKRYIFMLSLPSVTEAAIDKKRAILKQKVWLEALKAGAFAMVPFKIFIDDNDLKMLEETLTQCRSYFGLNDASLNVMAKELHVSVEQLKACIKCPHLLSVENKGETLQEELLKLIKEIFLKSGGFIATGLYFKKMFYLKTHFLDIVANDAKVLLKKEELFK